MEAEEGSMERNTKSRLDSHPGAPASLFTDDLILEILSRLPARSLHRFKCVSVPWRDLIADPANRNKLPQTLAGFLYITTDDSRHRHHFASVSGGVAPFDPCVQPNKYKDMAQVGSCNGLLLYRGINKRMASWARGDSRFVVCNPATGRWVELPPHPQAPADRYSRRAGLAFDPAVSSHFHVLRFEESFQENCITAVNIYSSRTGAWSHRDSVMADKIGLFFWSRCVFVGGMLYLMGNLASSSNDYVLLGVDMEGKVWRTISVLYGRTFGTIGWSQGCLHYAIASVDDNKQISGIELCFLQDCDSKELVLKHTASFNKLMSMTGHKYNVVGIHPDCNTIFLVSYEDGHRQKKKKHRQKYEDGTFVSYDMRHQKVGCIFNIEKSSTQQFLAYVPLFSESLADADGQ